MIFKKIRVRTCLRGLGGLGVLLLFFLFSMLFNLPPKKVESYDGSPQTVRKTPVGNQSIIYGTAWKEERTATLVEKAVRAGFRYIDTANQPKHYNEAGVGEGIANALKRVPGIRRSDITIQTKFSPAKGQDPDNMPFDPSAPLPDQVRSSLASSLKNLRTDYIDVLLLHSPLSTNEATMQVWRTFESFVADGTVRQLGLSNVYDLKTLKYIFEAALVKPTVLENRFYKKTNFDSEIRKFSKSHGIQYQSFWTLTAQRKELAGAPIQKIAASKGISAEMLMYAFVHAIGIVPISGTTSEKHMAEDVSLMTRKSVFTNQDEEDFVTMSNILQFHDR